MAPRHPAARLFDSRASDRSYAAPIGRQITAIQPLLLFVRYSLLACFSPSHGRKHPEAPKMSREGRITQQIEGTALL